MDVTVTGGRPTAIKGSKTHPFNRGWLCAKGRSALDLFDSPHRISTPLIRKRDKLVPSEWDEAYSIIVEKLQRIKEQYGPETAWSTTVMGLIPPAFWRF
jgi:predicted molibdopterin-dependent oxidoreductase YjgC